MVETHSNPQTEKDIADNIESLINHHNKWHGSLEYIVTDDTAVYVAGVHGAIFSIGLCGKNFATIAKMVQDSIAKKQGLSAAPSYQQKILVTHQELDGVCQSWYYASLAEMDKHLSIDPFEKWRWRRTGRLLTNLYGPAIENPDDNLKLFVFDGETGYSELGIINKERFSTGTNRDYPRRMGTGAIKCQDVHASVEVGPDPGGTLTGSFTVEIGTLAKIYLLLSEGDFVPAERPVGCGPQTKNFWQRACYDIVDIITYGKNTYSGNYITEEAINRIVMLKTHALAGTEYGDKQPALNIDSANNLNSVAALPDSSPEATESCEKRETGWAGPIAFALAAGAIGLLTNKTNSSPNVVKISEMELINQQA